MLELFNKLNATQYINGIVNFSNCSLTNSEISFLSKGLGFCYTAGAPDIGNIIQDLDIFKRRVRDDTQSGSLFEQKSFKLKSSFNLGGPFQLESLFYSIEQDYLGKNIKSLERKKLTKEEYKAIRSLRNYKKIIIKPTEKGSTVIILEKLSYINEGQKQLNNTQFYEQTITNLTGEFIHQG